MALISMLEKWKLSTDNKGFAGGVLMDLSKALDTINHHLLLAKLHAHLFFLLKDVGICNFVDNTTDESLENVLKSPEKNFMLAIRWFENNYMKLNKDKCCLIVSGYKHEKVRANIGKDLIWESNDVKLLGVTIYRDIKFNKHVLKLCSKANQKLSTHSRMANLLSFNKRHFLKLL